MSTIDKYCSLGVSLYIKNRNPYFATDVFIIYNHVEKHFVVFGNIRRVGKPISFLEEEKPIPNIINITDETTEDKNAFFSYSDDKTERFSYKFSSINKIRDFVKLLSGTYSTYLFSLDKLTEVSEENDKIYVESLTISNMYKDGVSQLSAQLEFIRHPTTI